ncbi:MAG TPA: DnaJ domain-containing protein [Myxococcota bacterium]|nr:DnaJ domain-containing protein [Myxococcota bacterium]
MSGLSAEDLRELAQLKEILENGTYYDLFGVGRQFERPELRTSYYAISRRFHPDRFYRQDLGGHEELLEQVFAGINLAYRTLDDPEERGRYNRELGIRPTKLAPPGPPPAKKKPGSGKAAKIGTAEEEDTHTVEFTITGIREDVENDVSAEEQVSETPKKRRPRKRRSVNRAPPAVVALQKQLVKRLKKARRYYESGLEDAQEGRWVKAASSFYLATQFDQRNADYREEYEAANSKARSHKATEYVRMARNAVDSGSHREAIGYYQKATELNPPDGVAYFQLGVLLLKLDAEDRAALDNLRIAVSKDGNKVDYRLALAEVYETHGMKLNAHREFAAVSQLDPGNDTAKAGLRRTR